MLARSRGATPSPVTRLILCSGKIYYDLAGHETRQDNPSVAIGRVELLYPFPQAEILALAESYPALEEVVWVQEEPRNMGARAHMSAAPACRSCPRHLGFGYIGRPERAASGEGYPVAHAIEQNRIVSTALDLGEAGLAVPAQAPRRALALSEAATPAQRHSRSIVSHRVFGPESAVPPAGWAAEAISGTLVPHRLS